MPVLSMAFFWLHIFYARCVLGSWPARGNGNPHEIYGGSSILLEWALMAVILATPIYVVVLLYKCRDPKLAGAGPIAPLLLATLGFAAFICYFALDAGGYFDWFAD